MRGRGRMIRVGFCDDDGDDDDVKMTMEACEGEQ